MTTELGFSLKSGTGKNDGHIKWFNLKPGFTKKLPTPDIPLQNFICSKDTKNHEGWKILPLAQFIWLCKVCNLDIKKKLSSDEASFDELQCESHSFELILAP